MDSINENMEIRIDIDQSDTPGAHPDTWWSIPAEESATIYQKYKDEVAQVKCRFAKKMRRAKKQRTEKGEDDMADMDCENDEDDKAQVAKNRNIVIDGRACASGEDEEDEDMEVEVHFDWTWPEGKAGTKIVDGQTTNVSSYTLNFDTMQQTNNDTNFVRKFRMIHVLLPCTVTSSDEEAFDVYSRRKLQPP